MNKIHEYLQKEITQLKTKSDVFKEHIRQLDCEIASESEAIGRIEGMMNHSERIFQSENSTKGFEEMEVGRLQSELEEKQQEKTVLEQKVQELNTKIQELQSLLSGMHKDCWYEYTSYDMIHSVEVERQRIARDIHDSIIQNLTAVMYKNEFIKKIIDTDYNRAKLELSAQDTMIRNCINELRNVIYNLHPMATDDLGLESVFYDLIERIKASTDMIVEYDYSSKRTELNSSIVNVLLRIIQELCSNSIKHSKGTTITIQIRIGENHIELIQSDDGVGYDYQSLTKVRNNNTGFGLQIMRERVHLLHGKLTIQNLGKGIEYRIEIPIPKCCETK